MDKGQKHVDLVGPTILIGIGVIMLLNNFGYLDWGLWEVISLWPVLLIAGGLEILIGRRSLLGAFAAALVVAALLAGAIWFVGIAPVEGGRSAQVIEISEPLDDIEAARVTIAPNVAQINVNALDDSGNFVEGSVHYRRNERITQNFEDGSTAKLVVKAEGNFNFIPVGHELQHSWDFSFNPAAELDLDTDIGIGDVNLDLRELAIDDVNVDFGIGETSLELPDSGEFDINIDGGIGTVVIDVPEGMGVRVRTDTGIVGRDLPASYTRHDDVYTSPNYEDADHRASIVINLGIGTVSIRETDK